MLADAEEILNDLGVTFEVGASEATAAAMLAASINYPIRGCVTWKSTVGTNVASATAQKQHELALEVQILGLGRVLDDIVGAVAERVRRLIEDDRVLGDLVAELGGVLDVVTTDTKDGAGLELLFGRLLKDQAHPATLPVLATDDVRQAPCREGITCDFCRRIARFPLWRPQVTQG